MSCLLTLSRFTGKDCGFPGRPGNGSTIGAEKFFYPGEEVTFQCDNGYILFGADRRICQEDGSWSGALPECSKILTITRLIIIQSIQTTSNTFCLKTTQKVSFYYIASLLKMPKWSIWRVLRKTLSCGQKVLPDWSIVN